MESEALALTLPIRRLVEFLLRTGSIDSRFTGFDRALEGARLHRKLQRAAVKEYPDYQAEAALKQDYACAQITYTLEGRADGIFTTMLEEGKSVLRGADARRAGHRHHPVHPQQPHRDPPCAQNRRARAGVHLCGPP